MEPLPDATPRPGERASDVVQIGFSRGWLQLDSQDLTHLDDGFFDEKLVIAMCDRDVQGIRRILRIKTISGERNLYIEHFLDEIELACTRPGIQKFKEAVQATGERLQLFEETVLGLIAFHFFMQDVPRAPSRNLYPDPTRRFHELVKATMANRRQITPKDDSENDFKDF